MQSLSQALVALSALGFFLAAIGSYVSPGNILSVAPEGFSRASTNLALIAIALAVVWKKSE